MSTTYPLSLTIRVDEVFSLARVLPRPRRAERFINAGPRAGVFTPVVDRVVALDEIAAAHRHLEPGARMGKVVVTAQSY